jgi:putative ABC transport system permease protein
MHARLLLASLAARRGRALWAFLAVTVGVAVATTLTALSLQVGDELARSLRASGPNFVVLPPGAAWTTATGEAGAGPDAAPARAGLSLAADDIVKLKTCFWKNNLLAAAPELDVRAKLGATAVGLTGTWFEHPLAIGDESWLAGVAPLHPSWRIDGRWPHEDEAALVLGSTLAQHLDLHLGETVAVAAAGGPAERWRVTTIVHAGGLEDDRAWTSLGAAQRLAARPGAVDRIWLSAMVLPAPKKAPPDPARDPQGYERFTCAAYPANVAKTLSEQLGGADVLPMSERVAAEGEVVSRLGLLMLLLALAALTAASLGLFATTTATVVERRGELALLRALGASPRALASLLLGESLLVAIAAGVTGWLLGALAAGMIRTQSFGGSPAAQPLLLPLALALAAAVALLGTLGPLRVALRIDPATVLRG